MSVGVLLAAVLLVVGLFGSFGVGLGVL